ncbi:DUF3108 domain-containing protein [Longimicrobium sp.]|uniref:DUF3108 domain-containing protein n=1 Tax=Longimicrobium sp. TaxID=2029185 RepID=UPI002C86938E|nr:DUF3108 domain-containing protein [Longimicrobium sp.]HSU13693.1 DUF3108 domain-containing protein [Longimicrobium sp.]
MRAIHRTIRTVGLPLAAAMLALPAPAQSRGALPFAPGEACTYRGSGPLGRMGSGTFAVDAEQDGGRPVYLLRFDFRGRLGIVGVENHTRSWFDPAETASFHFTKTERSPVSTKRQDVRMDVRARRWTGTQEGGEMTTAAPLDELSFVFFLRTLRLAEGDSYTFARHYDTARNPVRVRVIGRGRIRVPAGEFNAVEVEMRVRDAHHYNREGVIQFHFTDDPRHVPLRIESQIPVAGRMVLSLEAMTATCGGATTGARATDE